MADPALNSSAEVLEDFGAPPAREHARWMAWLKLCNKDVESWHERGRSIVKRYKDDRNDSGIRKDNPQRYNILWSNVQTMAPALYARTPRPQVERRFRDADPIGRVASTALERCVSADMEPDDFDGIMRSSVQDYLLPGLATVRVFYQPTYASGGAVPASDADPVVAERAPLRLVYWEDYRQTPARSWSEVTAVGYKATMTREELVKRFPDCGALIPLKHKQKGGQADDGLDKHGDVFMRGVVWEIWDKASKKVYWICPDYPEKPLDVKDDPLGLEGFFPSPEPLIANPTSDSMNPTADFYLYQDQAAEIDKLTARIGALVEGLKLVGAYAGRAKSELSRILTAEDGTMVPVDGWEAFAGGGAAGVDRLLWFMPVEQLGEVIVGLYKAREQMKTDLYEISGISDIVRGQGEASETATAQRIKGRFATLRLEDRQKRVANFARDLIRKKAEVIAEHFAPQTIQQMSGLPELTGQPEDQQAIQQFGEALKLLKSEKLRGFRLDIETDSTIAPDEQADKEAATELVTALGQYFTGVAPLVAQQVVPLDVAKEVMLFVVRRYKAGRDLEAALEKIDQAPPPLPAEGGADPQVELAKIDQQKAKDAADHEIALAEQARKDRETDAKIAAEVKRLENEAEKLAIERQRLAHERECAQFERQRGEFEATAKVAEFEAGREDADIERRNKEAEANGLPATEQSRTFMQEAGEKLSGATEQLESLAQAMAQITQAMQAQQEMMNAPIEIVREGGKAVATRRNGVMRPIVRGEDGRAVSA